MSDSSECRVFFRVFDDELARSDARHSGCQGTARSRRPACGSSWTGARDTGSAGARRSCGAPGWPGQGFRVVIPTWNRTLPTVVACVDETLRRFGSAPTYALTANERTVTIDRVAGVAVRHPELVAADRHHGLQIVACQPADPESKGGSKATVRIAKTDLLATQADLLPRDDDVGVITEATNDSVDFGG